MWIAFPSYVPNRSRVSLGERQLLGVESASRKAELRHCSLSELVARAPLILFALPKT
jgi:hypothetical protein